MAAATFAHNDASIRYSGYTEAGPTVSSRSTYRLRGRGAQINFRCTAESLTLTYLIGSGAAIQLTVDGVVSTPTLGAANTWNTLTIFTGLASGVAHEVEIKFTTAGANFYLDASTPCFSATDAGGTPTLSLPTPTSTLPATGTAYPIVQTAAIRTEGGWADAVTDGYASPSGYKTAPNNSVLLRFAVSTGTTEVWLWGIRNGSVTRSIANGGTPSAATSHPSLAASIYWGWVKVADLDGSAQEVEIVWSYTQGNAFAWGAHLVGGTLGAAPAARSQMLAFYGDSITQVATDSSRNALTGFPWLVSRLAGAQCCSRGISSTTVKGSGQTSARTQQVTNATPTPSACVVLYGTNDMGGVPGGAATTTEFQTVYQAMITNLQASPAGSMKVYCLGILNRTGYDGTTRDARNAAIQAAVAAVADPDVTYVDTGGWINPATNTPDGVHPDATGNQLIVDRLATLLGISGASTSAPAAVLLAGF